MLTVFVRSTLLYVFAVLALRVMGKRQIGQLQPFELVVVMLIAELAATPMGSVGIPLLYGLLPMAALVMCHGMITYLDMRFPRFARWMCGEPTVLMRGGVICEKALRKQGVSLQDLLESLRISGQSDIADVDTVVMEPGGQISVFAKAQLRPVTPRDLQLKAGEDGLPLPLVVDGRAHAENLKTAGMSENALRGVLHEMGLGGVGDVLLLSQSADGSFYGQARGGNRAVYKKA